jgi:hypothetical protein
MNSLVHFFKLVYLHGPTSTRKNLEADALVSIRVAQSLCSLHCTANSLLILMSMYRIDQITLSFFLIKSR